MANIGDIVATATLDVAPFQQSTRSLKTYLRGIDQSLKGLESNVKSSGKTLGSMKNLLSQTGKSLTGYETLLKKQTEWYQKLKDEIGDVNEATAEQKQQLAGAQTAMLTTASKVETLRLKYSGLAKEIAIQESVFTKFGNAATIVGTKMTSAGDAMQTLGGNMTKYVTAPLTLGIGAVVKSATSWESAFAGVKKTNDEVVDSNGKVTYSYNDLETGLRNMAKELPSSHQEIAAVAEAAGQLGIKTQDVTSFTRTMIDLGESTNLSAEEAASSIAKIANITGLTSDEYQRFGSSVVALGNNFATTERDIVALTNRMAAAGTLAGLTNQEILGLATAMSSVGIEAESGGTAMTQTLTAIESAAAKGGESLDQFAKVAGMSSEQFAKTWNEKPIEAVQSFIKGLGELDKKGESATMMLDEMGLSGVRQSNMLKSLALASETMTSAVDTSNKAWEENTALTNEAGIRYETTESKLKMLKNEAVDAAIDLGGPFVDALRDGLEASKPLIATLGDAAKAFSELDPELQRNIVKWTGIAMAAGPALKVLGMVTSTTGKAVTGIGSLSRSIGKLAGRNAERKALEGLALNSAKLGTEAAGGATKVGGLTTAIGGLNPVVAGTAAALAVGIAGFVVWDKTVGESIRRTNKWGSDIGKEADKSLSKYQEFSDGASNALSNFDTATASTAENAKKNLSAMNEDIAKSAEKLNKDLEKSFNELPKHLQEQTKQTVEERKKANEESVKLSNDLATQTQAILSKHNGEVSKLTGDERTIVMNNMRQMNSEKVRLTDLSAKEQKQVLAALNGDIDDMTNKQRQTALDNLKQFHKDQKQEFMTNNANLKKTLGEDTEEYAQAYKKLSEESKASTLQIAEQMVQLMQANGASTSEIQDQLNGLGLSYWTQQDVIKRATSGMKESNDLIAKSTAGMSTEASKANELWKSLVWDEKKAEVKSNAKEEVTKSIKSADGWNQMKLILKNADLTSNAKEIIFNAIQETGKWNNLPIDPKLLKADNVQLIQKLADSKGSLEEYNNLQPELKTLIADGPAKMTYEETQRALEAYENISPQMKLLLGSNEDVNSKVDTAKANLNSYQMLNPDTKLLKGDNSSVSNAAQQGENSLNSFSGNNPYAKILKGDSSSVQQQSRQGENSLNSFNQNNPKAKTLVANDHASGPAYSAKSAVDSFNWLPDVITKTLKVVKNFVGLEDGTNYHKGGPAVVNDQKGPTYREFVQLPSGEGFIPEGRNVFLDLPRGSKVLKASKTKSLFPHYAEGVGFENTKVASVTSRLRDVQDEGQLTTNSNNASSVLSADQIVNAIVQVQSILSSVSDEQKRLLTALLNKDTTVVIDENYMTNTVNKNNAINDAFRYW